MPCVVSAPTHVVCDVGVQVCASEALEQQLPYFSGCGDTAAAAHQHLPRLLSEAKQHWRSVRRHKRAWGEWKA